MPTQQSALVVHAPPSCEHVWPDGTHWPPWHSPPVQQSASAVQGGALVHVLLVQVSSGEPQSPGALHDMPASGRHVAAHEKPVGEPPLGAHTCEQQSSHCVHDAPAALHAAPPKQRLTPIDVVLQSLLQQFCDAPWPPHTSPSLRHEPFLAQRLSVLVLSANVHSPLQHWLLAVHTSFSTEQPHSAWQMPVPCALGTHSVSQHERTPPHGSFSAKHAFSTWQRSVTGSQVPSQQSLDCAQISPFARQKLSNAQRPDRHSPEQHVLLPEHVSPSVLQPLPRSVHTCEAGQLLSQQSAAVTHEPPAGLHVGEAAHWPLTHASEQQSAARAQPWPTALHSPGEAQRLTPSTSSAQRALQQSALAAQFSPTSLHAETGTSHLPATQLSEQQSVLTAHGWWNDRQLEHDTPAKHCDVPKQQPPVHDCVVH